MDSNAISSINLQPLAPSEFALVAHYYSMGRAVNQLQIEINSHVGCKRPTPRPYQLTGLMYCFTNASM